MAKETLPFMDALHLMKKYAYNSNLKIKESEEFMNSIFPPRYFLEMHFATNPALAKFVNKYINYNYESHFKITNIDVIQLMREFSKFYNIQEPIFPKKSPKGDFKKKFDSLHDAYKHGISKPEAEIMMMSIDKLPRWDQQHYYKLGTREANKLARMTKAEIRESIKPIKKSAASKSNTKSIYATYSDYLIKTLMNKELHKETCSKCQFYKNDTPYIESNIKYDINDNHVDILILSDQPHNGKIMKEASYKILQEYIKFYQLENMHYVIGNIITCETKKDKLADKDIIVCKNRVEALIKACSPTVILALGSKVCKWMGLDSTGMVNSCGSKTEWKGYEVIKSVHPSYLVRNQTNEAYDIFNSAFREAMLVVNPPSEEVFKANGRKRPGDIIADGTIYAAKPLPKKLYEKEWILINATREGFKHIEMIFRNADTNEKVVRKVPCSQFEYYYLMKDINGISKPALKAKDVYCKKGPWKFSPDKNLIEQYNKTILYEGNVALEAKACVDYYYHTKPEKSYLPQVFRYDIEHDMSDFHGTDISGPYKITYISAQYGNDYYIWILDSDKLSIDVKSTYKDNKGKDRPLNICEFAGDESLMLQHFWYTLLVTCDPDIMTAWNNAGFDFPYTINRSTRLQFKKNQAYLFSNFDNCERVIDMLGALGKTYSVVSEGDDWSKHKLSGVIVADLMVMYVDQHQGDLEKTSLDFISELELNLHKKPFPAVDAPKKEWIDYNLWDTELMELIDNKVQCNNFKFMLSKITTGDWDGCSYAMGIVNPILLSDSKRKGNVLRTYADPNVFTNKYLTSIIGGYTHTNDGGLKNMLVDYDGKSFYPSIMITFNMGPNTLRMTIPPEDAFNIMVNNYDPKKTVIVYPKETECCRGVQADGYEMTLEDIVKTIKERNYIIVPSGAIYCSIEEEKSIFYDPLVSLGKRRDSAKSNMYDEFNNLLIDKYNEQLSLKISSNSFYGVYLFKKFMFFNTTIGAGITMTGRFFLKAVMLAIDINYKYLDKDIIEAVKSIDIYGQQDLPVKSSIYADTDGCVICFEDIIPKELPLEKQLDMAEKELLKLNPYIEQVVDQIYPMFNKSGNVRLMKFKEDWFAARGLFYKKKHKRYAIYKVRENGKNKDELLLRGVQTRRSDSPKLIKEKLTELIELVVRKPNIELDEIFDAISTIEDGLYDACENREVSLGKPVKFGKPIGGYKKPPFQIDAMLLWNDIHKRTDFKVGDKGMLFNIQYIDFDYLKEEYGLTDEDVERIRHEHKTSAIAIPQTLERIPDYIDIDAKLTIEKTFIIPYTNILEPIIEESSVSDIPMIDFL